MINTYLLLALMALVAVAAGLMASDWCRREWMRREVGRVKWRNENDVF